MQTADDLPELFGLFSYQITGAVIATIVLAFWLVFGGMIIFRKKKRRVIREPTAGDREKIRKKYLAQIEKIEVGFKSGKISRRKAYQGLSAVIRNFIFEMTGVKVQNLVLAEIDKRKMPVLYELIREYYNPEFAVESKGDFLASAGKTKGVIERWK